MPVKTTSTSQLKDQASAVRNAARVARAPTGKQSAMFERFTDPARRVLVLAQEEAGLLKHNFIGTEHICSASCWRTRVWRPRRCSHLGSASRPPAKRSSR